MLKRFAKEEEDYLDYTAPRIRVLGASVAPGIADGGRRSARPVRYHTARRALSDAFMVKFFLAWF